MKIQLLTLIPCLTFGGLALVTYTVGCEAPQFYDAEVGALTCDWESGGHDLQCIAKQGTRCSADLGICQCPRGEKFCRQRVLAGECEGTERCRPEAECAATCFSISDCPQPPDQRCGIATCVNGACGLIIFPGPAESQVRGDCKTTYCDSMGHASEKEDLGDLPNDGKECTQDTCHFGVPKNLPYPTGVLCPTTLSGVCRDGRCVECADIAPINNCPPSFSCDYEYCVPDSCVQNNACGGECRPCDATFPCNVSSDCESGVCQGGFCATATCTDGVKNGSEGGTDCGPISCGNQCPDGSECTSVEQCISGVCWGGRCQAPTCTDAVMNGDEIATDCGGSCKPCPP